MTLSERVFIYCERGTNAALGAEPINAVSNAGFFLAALVFWQLILWRPPEQRSPDHYLFVALVFAIFFGSTAFHIYADRGTELADIIPIGVFMVVYLGFALNRFLNVPPGCTVFLVVLFAALVGAAMQVHCWDGGIGLAGGATDAKPCMNGSMGYLPALGALVIVSMLTAERGHKAAPYLLAATAIFAVSVLLRSLDMSLCDQIVVDGRETGTHFIWHLLNAVVLFLLMRASLETGTRPLAPADLPEGTAEQKPAAEARADAAEAKDDAKDETKGEAKAEAAPTSEEKPKSEPNPESKSESKSKSVAKPRRKPKAKTPPKQETKAAAQTKAEPVGKGEPEPEAKADDPAGTGEAAPDAPEELGEGKTGEGSGTKEPSEPTSDAEGSEDGPDTKKDSS